MDITVDTSALIAVICGEASRDRAIEATTGHSLVGPSSLHWEVGNALSAMLKRNRITLPEANACVEVYLKIPIRLVDIDLTLAMGLVKKLRTYAYDAYMLACAQQAGTPLLTLDDALKMHAETLGIQVLEI